YDQLQEKHLKPSLDEVLAILKQTVTELSKVYIVVDAVDEYPETQRQILLKYLLMIGSTVNLMITSRPHLTPDSSLPNLDTIEIYASRDDLKRYVDAQIQISARLAKHAQTQVSLREEIHSKITNAVDGMFLLAKLHIESLSMKSTLMGVQEALKALPNSLNDSYDNVIRQIDGQNAENKRIAHMALTWVANARRPLKVLELQTALAVEPGSKSLNEANVLDVDTILAVCAGLIIKDEQLSVVRLVHYTTQQYLDHIQPWKFPNAQTEITRSLLTYLAFDEVRVLDPFQTKQDAKNLPLLQYAQDYCLMHATGPPEGTLR
ncbi:hypothetical protein B0H11DRAFT_1624932, partial [Mycena galericulata]